MLLGARRALLGKSTIAYAIHSKLGPCFSVIYHRVSGGYSAKELPDRLHSSPNLISLLLHKQSSLCDTMIYSKKYVFGFGPSLWHRAAKTLSDKNNKVPFCFLLTGPLKKWHLKPLRMGAGCQWSQILWLEGWNFQSPYPTHPLGRGEELKIEWSSMASDLINLLKSPKQRIQRSSGLKHNGADT